MKSLLFILLLVFGCAWLIPFVGSFIALGVVAVGTLCLLNS